MGMALRFAYALGLHVRNEDPSAAPSKKEMLVRVWWSLYILEREISIVTGRPSTIVDTCCSVPLPIPLAEENITDDVAEMDRLRKAHSSAPTISPISQMTPYSIGTTETPPSPTVLTTKADANSGSFFKALVQVAIINQNTLTALYSAGTAIRPVNEIQLDIIRLGQRLEQWVASLPVDLNFQNRQVRSNNYRRERMLLGFQYCSAKILLTRPCLGGLGQLGEQNMSDNFVRRMASTSVDTAKIIVNLLPDQPNTVPFYENGPWWSIVHYLMQAVSVFLLALLNASRIGQEPSLLASCLRKLVNWLREMQDPLAERAYRMSFDAFQAVAARLSIDISDLWARHAEAYGESIAGVGAQNWHGHTMAVEHSGPFAPILGQNTSFAEMDPYGLSVYPPFSYNPSEGYHDAA
jgi:hypothetical protein